MPEPASSKNLYLPEEREGGVPRFMGNAGEGSKRSWQLDFRAAAVRRQTGGAGIVLLSATPAKNSPLEFYNLLQYIDHDLWARMGIRDPEAFIDRYCRLEMRPIIQSDLKIVNRSACVGFKNLDELRAVLFRYGDFKTAEEVGLKLPEPTVNLVEVPLDARQEAKYEVYVRLVEVLLALDSADEEGAGDLAEELAGLAWKAREAGIVNFPDIDPEEPGKNRAAVLGLLTRLSLVAVHAELDDQLGWDRAEEVNDVHSPKFDALAERVIRTPHCGHIIFVDNVAAHLWVREVLRRAGIPEERIAILNAETAPAAERPRIAAEFNGDPELGVPPKYDVVIANAVAYEGVDLQTRTCAIHHLDLPWEPATLQQRNGRGVRQGNKLSSIEINYYFARRSQDGMRFNLIQGKRGWMVDLLQSQARETNNPGAQMDLGPDEIMLLISRDPESTRQRLEAVKAAARQRALDGVRDNAVRLLVAANARYRRAALSDDAMQAAAWRAEAEERLDELARTDPEAWPWAARAWKVRDQDVFIDPAYVPLFEGDTVTRTLANGAEERLAFGRVLELDGKAAIAYRNLGAAHWRLYDGKGEGLHLRPEHLAGVWPAAEDEAQTTRGVESLLAGRFPAWSDLRWATASASWRAWAWERFGARVVRALLSRSLGRVSIPAVVKGELVTVAHEVELPRVELLPWTDEGFERFKALAYTAEEGLGELAEIAQSWWGRRLPRGVKKAGQEAARAAA